MDFSAFATQAVIALSLLLIIWYFVGTLWNRRRSLQVLAWLREGVRPLGGEGHIRWIGRSAFLITLQDTTSPFQEVAILVFLQPREALPVWLFNLLRGEGDFLLIQAQLHKKPLWELEITNPRTRLGREWLKQVAKWSRENRPPYEIAYPSPQGRQMGQVLLSAIPEKNFLRLGVRKEGNHLSLGLKVPPLTPTASQNLLSLIQRLGETILSGT